MTSCFIYKVIRDYESIIHKCLSIRISSSGVYKLMVYLAIVNKTRRHVTLCWQDSSKNAHTVNKNSLVIVINPSVVKPTCVPVSFDRNMLT